MTNVKGHVASPYAEAGSKAENCTCKYIDIRKLGCCDVLKDSKRNISGMNKLLTGTESRQRLRISIGDIIPDVRNFGCSGFAIKYIEMERKRDFHISIKGLTNEVIVRPPPEEVEVYAFRRNFPYTPKGSAPKCV